MFVVVVVASVVVVVVNGVAVGVDICRVVGYCCVVVVIVSDVVACARGVVGVGLVGVVVTMLSLHMLLNMLSL